MPHLIELLVIGLVAGTAGGMFGIGGGLIMVPAMMLLPGMGLTRAIGTSLGAQILPIGLLGAGVYHRSGQLVIRYAVLLAIGLLLGNLLGAVLANQVDQALLKRFYGIFLLGVGLRYVLQRKAAGAPAEPAAPPDAHPVKLLGIGLMAGVAGGMFGIGGGLIMVPALVAWCALDLKTAVGTSLGAQIAPIGLLGAGVYWQEGNLDPAYAGILAVALLVGNLFGALFAKRVNKDLMQKLYGGFLLLVSVRYLFFS